MVTIPLLRRPVHVGRGAVRLLEEDLAAGSGAGPHVLVSDDTVAPLHAAPLLARLRARGLRAELLTVPAGERSKVRETKAALEDRLLGMGAGRDAAVVAVGGGMVGDLAGFLAATWHRGIALYQVPTTLLAMVDAAIGGKTGVDLPGGKNLVGAFHPARGVYADLDALATLPDPVYRAGFAEMVKAGAIGSVALFRAMEAGAPALLARDGAALEGAIAASVRVKARLVARDPREEGPRAALNFGHTAGHALEAASGYVLPHGEAVAIGMAAEAALAREVHGFPAAHQARVRELLSRLGLPIAPPRGLLPDRLRSAARADKKGRGGRIRCALPARLGRMPNGPDPTVEVEEDALLRALGIC